MPSNPALAFVLKRANPMTKVYTRSILKARKLTITPSLLLRRRFSPFLASPLVDLSERSSSGSPSSRPATRAATREWGTSSPRSRRASLSYGNRPSEAPPPPQAVSSAAALLRALVRAFIVWGGSGKGSPSYPARMQAQACRKHSPLSGL
jgi:hypothetical protein